MGIRMGDQSGDASVIAKRALSIYFSAAPLPLWHCTTRSASWTRVEISFLLTSTNPSNTHEIRVLLLLCSLNMYANFCSSNGTCSFLVFLSFVSVHVSNVYDHSPA